MENFTAILGYIIAGVTALSTIVVTIKGQAKDASSKAKDATIESQDRQIKTYGDENRVLRAADSELRGKVQALENMVTQAPQIIELTKVVTQLVTEVKNQTKQGTDQNKQVINLLTKMVSQNGEKHNG